MAKALPLDELEVFDTGNPPSRNNDFAAGSVFLAYKEKNWTSFDLVRYVRNRVGLKKVGHAGTLDPMATGLLIICTGKATKSISQIQDLRKKYRAEITFGFSTPTYDAESAADEEAPYDHLSLELLQNQLEQHFTGEIQQVPPMYSALKRGGKKLYELARRGKSIELSARPVTVYKIDILDWSKPVLTLDIECSKGTYIRSIAHDLGLSLDSRAHLSALERTAIGTYKSENALKTEQIDNLLGKDG